MKQDSELASSVTDTVLVRKKVEDPESQSTITVGRNISLPPEEGNNTNQRYFKIDAKTYKMQVLVSAFTPQQQDQYEVYRRATFSKGTVKRLMINVCKCPVPQNAVIAMSGIAKVYVGQIVEEACKVKDKWQEVGPLQPKHLREAFRRLKLQQVISTRRNKALFC